MKSFLITTAAVVVGATLAIVFVVPMVGGWMTKKTAAAS